MSVATKAKRIKLVFGIAIPVLVLVTTIVMVSMSFAWFSQDTTASIQSINLATQKAFVLEFGNSGGTNDNLPYMGQEALNEENGTLLNPNESEDGAYYFVSAINISTQGENKDLSLKLDSVKILNGGVYLDYYNDEGEANSSTESLNIENYHRNSNVPLAFTWFFKEHQDGDPSTPEVDDPATNKETKDGKDVMKSILPQGDEKWFTPYGTMVFESGDLQTVNGDKLTALPPAPQDIKAFAADDGDVFDFYIVFAPERVFWSQFFGYTEELSAFDYTTEKLKEMIGKYYNVDGSTYRMYYSDERYQSSQFSFNATLNVIG